MIKNVLLRFIRFIGWFNWFVWFFFESYLHRDFETFYLKATGICCVEADSQVQGAFALVEFRKVGSEIHPAFTVCLGTH